MGRKRNVKNQKLMPEKLSLAYEITTSITTSVPSCKVIASIRGRCLDFSAHDYLFPLPLSETKTLEEVASSVDTDIDFE